MGVCVCVCVCVHVKPLQLCLILCDLLDCSPPGSSVHDILQGRTLVGRVCVCVKLLQSCLWGVCVCACEAASVLSDSL